MKRRDLHRDCEKVFPEHVASSENDWRKLRGRVRHLRTTSMRTGGVGWLVLLAVLPSVIAIVCGCSSFRLTGPEIIVSDRDGAKISPTFMGLSQEWGYAQQIAGDEQTGVNETYRQLLRNLTSYGSGPLIIRVGGYTVEATKYPTETTVRPLAELAGATDTHFYLSVFSGSAKYVDMAVSQARNYISHMPAGSVDAIEVGNEPESYFESYDEFLCAFIVWKDHIAPILPTGTTLMGPSWGNYRWIHDHQDDFLSAAGDAIDPFSYHWYTAAATVPHVADWLLLPSTATEGPASVAPFVAIAHKRGIPFRMGEMNSLAARGAPGISDTFQSALWAIDEMFRFANVGVDGVNWHSAPGCPYDAIAIDTQMSGSTTTYSTTVRPLYYGLLFFQQATGNHAHLIQAPANIGANMTAWATADENGTHHLVIINKNENTSETVAVKDTGYHHAQVVRLTAESYLSKDGITLAGQTFDNSPDGKPVGVFTAESYDLPNGEFAVPVGKTSAVLVTFQK